MSNGTLYKVLDSKRRPRNGGQGRYPDVGEWTPHLEPGRIVPCLYGYHLAPLPFIVRWLGPTIYAAEPCPDHEPVVQGRKVVTCAVRLTRQTAWDARSARLFAADCAEAAMLGERALGREPDERLWDAVRVARAFACGEATDSQLDVAEAAAEDTSWDAGCDAGWDAAWVAAGVAARAAASVNVWYAADAAVWAASVAAVKAAAKDVPEDAAKDAACVRFGERLTAYLDGRDPGPVTALYGHEDGSEHGGGTQ